MCTRLGAPSTHSAHGCTSAPRRATRHGSRRLQAWSRSLGCHAERPPRTMKHRSLPSTQEYRRQPPRSVRTSRAEMRARLMACGPHFEIFEGALPCRAMTARRIGRRDVAGRGGAPSPVAAVVMHARTRPHAACGAAWEGSMRRAGRREAIVGRRRSRPRPRNIWLEAPGRGRGNVRCGGRAAGEGKGKPVRPRCADAG